MTILIKIVHLLIRTAHFLWLVWFLYGYLPGPLTRLLFGGRPEGEWVLNVLMIVAPLLWFTAGIALFFRCRWAWITSLLFLVALVAFMLVGMPYQMVGWQILPPTILLLLLWLSRREYFSRIHEKTA